MSQISKVFDYCWRHGLGLSCAYSFFGNENLLGASAAGFAEQTEFVFRNYKFCSAAIKADQKLGKYPDVRPTEILKSKEMDGNFCTETA